MKRYLIFSLVIVISFVLVGCAFTVHKTTLDYTYQGKTPIKSDKYSKSALVGAFTDQRGTSTPNMIINFRNGYGAVTSGGYEAEMPISVVVQEAIKSGLNQAGLTGNNNSNYSLTGSVEKYYVDAKAERPFQRNYKGVLSVKIQLTDVKTNKVIFRDTFTGEGFSSDDSSDRETIVRDTFKGSLNNLVEKLIADQYFIQQFE